jgi:multiple sugar transport system substrate-binding protein
MKAFGKLMICVLLIIASGAFLFAGGAQEGKGPVKLLVWYGMSSSDAEYMQVVIDMFNKAQPRILTEGWSSGGWDPLWPKLDSSFAAGSPPGVIGFHVQEVAPYANKKMLIDIGPIMAKLKIDTSDFVPLALEGGQYKGVQYGIPIDVHPIAMSYNANMFSEAGLNVDKPPTTLEELVSYGKKLTKTDGSRWGLGIEIPACDAMFIFTGIFYQFNGKYISDDNKKSLFNSDPARKAIQFYLDAINKYKIVPPNEEQAAVDFRKLRVAMVFHGPWHNALGQGFPSIKELNTPLKYKTAPLPKIGDTLATWKSSHVLAPIKQKDTKIETAAVEFINFFSENSIVWAKSGQLPVRKSVQKNPEFANNTFKDGFVASMPFAKYMPLVPYGWAELFECAQDRPVLRALNSVIQGGDISSALSRAEKEMNAILDRFYK